MEDILKQVVDKISSYNIFNNLYPGIIFCYLLKVMFNINVLTNNWFENFIVFYFVGMLLSRVGSLIIEPLIKKVKIKKNNILKQAPYSDYKKASDSDPLISTLNEVNNTYRTLTSCFFCAFIYKIYNVICIKFKFSFFQDNKDWIILIGLIILFSCSYVKQTNYIRKRVEATIEKENNIIIK